MIRVTGPRPSKMFKDGTAYDCHCEVCKVFSYVDLPNGDAVRGDLPSEIQAFFEHRSLPPVFTLEEVNLRMFARQTATHFYNELKSRRCLHCPVPLALTTRLELSGP